MNKQVPTKLCLIENVRTNPEFSNSHNNSMWKAKLPPRVSKKHTPHEIARATWFYSPLGAHPFQNSSLCSSDYQLH
jgi:hypothetical protein